MECFMTTMTPDYVIQVLKANVAQCIQTMDKNGDGMIDRNELAQALCNSGVDWCIAWNTASEVFNRLDRDCNGKITAQELSGCECITQFANRIQLCSPSNGTRFCNFPRTTRLAWSPVVCAAQYLVEIQFQSGCNWIPMISTQIPCISYEFQFIGAQPGRWKITALDGQGKKLAESDWWTFYYQV
jgi:hypothetical protein